MLMGFLVHGVPIQCINRAAITYYVPAQVIVAILQTEGGNVGLAKPNTNGTADYGPMQINSLWLKTLSHYGYTAEDLQYNACINVMVGTWILSQKIANGAMYWQGVADYHSHTFVLNQSYQRKVKIFYFKFQQMLKPVQNPKIEVN